jgi:hypothetical protein
MAAGEPFRMAIFDKHIELVARLETPEQVDEMIRRLTVGRLMIAPAAAQAGYKIDLDEK